MNLYEAIKNNLKESDVYNKVMSTDGDNNCTLTIDLSDLPYDSLVSFIKKNNFNLTFGEMSHYDKKAVNAHSISLSGDCSEMKRFLEAFKKDTEKYLKDHPEDFSQEELNEPVEDFMNNTYFLDFKTTGDD